MNALPGKRLARKPSITGATLLETLVTVALLSIGLLTATRLLTESIQLLGANRYGQQAVRITADLAELLGNTRNTLAAGVPTPADHNCAHNICSPDQFLADSLQLWHLRIARQLPGGTGTVELEHSTSGTIAHIRVAWQTPHATAAEHATQVIQRATP